MENLVKYNSHWFKKLLIINYALLIIFSSCSISHKLSKSADKILLQDSVISTGHIGISVYEPSTNKYWYNYNATKYFVPASNTKLFTCYAGMKYLGDSLVGLRYYETDSNITIYPTGDPTFLYPDFEKQPVFNFLKNTSNLFYSFYGFFIGSDLGLGQGWAWDDYLEPFMTHRSAFPIYGNIYTITKIKDAPYFKTTPDSLALFLPEHEDLSNGIGVMKDWGNNDITIVYGKKNKIQVPFVPTGADVMKLVCDTIHKLININLGTEFKSPQRTDQKIIHSQPTDSLLKPMMHRSDNFFAEQTLLMVSNEHLGYMNDEDIIDTLLKTDFKDVPQQPKWVDGSGLSRYNLFTPQDFVYILNKMKNEFGLKRLQAILPTGGEGTLKNYYLEDSGFIYAKTGSLSNNNSLSGYLVTKKNKLLIFSILLNNFQGNTTVVKDAIQQFLEAIREKY